MALAIISHKYSKCFSAGANQLIAQQIDNSIYSFIFNNIFIPCHLDAITIEGIIYNNDEKSISIFGDIKLVNFIKNESDKIFRRLRENCQKTPLFQVSESNNMGSIKISFLKG